MLNVKEYNTFLDKLFRITETKKGSCKAYSEIDSRIVVLVNEKDEPQAFIGQGSFHQIYNLCHS